MFSAAMKTTALLLLLVPAVAHAAPPSGREILEHQEEARKIASFQARATMSTVRDGEKEKAPKTFRWWRKLGGDGARFVSLTRFDEPATIRGEGVLIREGKTLNDVLLYLPHFKKIRRVEGQSQSSSFFGSVFSYTDVATPHADDDTAKVLREEDCPGAKTRCWVVDVTPATEADRDRTGYSHSIQWVREDNWITIAGDFYDQKGTLWKRLTATDVKEVDTKAHKWLPHHIQLQDVRGKRTTVLELSDVKTGATLDDTLFTEQSLANE